MVFVLCHQPPNVAITVLEVKYNNVVDGEFVEMKLEILYLKYQLSKFWLNCETENVKFEFLNMKLEPNVINLQEN